MKEKIMTKANFARHIGRDRSYVTRLADAGRLVMAQDGKRVHVEASKEMIEKTRGKRRPDVQARLAQRRGTAIDESPSSTGGGNDTNKGNGEDGNAEITNTNSRAHWERELSKEKALTARMEREEAARNLVQREDVEFVLRDLGNVWRGLLDNMAARWAPVLVTRAGSVQDMDAALNEVAEDLQHQLSETLQKRREGLGKRGQE